jgi:TrmH family RNA methyltransferase
MSDSTGTLIRSLHTRKNRERRGLTLAEGVRLVEEALDAGVPVKVAVIAPALEATPRGAALAEALRARVERVESVDDRALAALASTEHPQGVLAVIEPKVWSLEDLLPASRSPLPGSGSPLSVVLGLDAVQDPGNVGTMIRTAHALGAAGVIALPGTADLSNPKAIRAAMGASFRIPCVAAPIDAVLAWTAERHGELWAATSDGEDIALLTAHRSPLTVLVVGNEGAGLSPEVERPATRKVTIPMRPGVESLNVAVAAGILLYELFHER